MAFPSDLSNVVLFKVHPAIGVARLSVNDDYFVFGPKPDSYKSKGLIKRQAVQFRVFAYADNHVGLGELTADLMTALGIKAVWSAKVANRKIASQIGTPLNGSASVISAAASSDTNAGKLIGSLPGFAEGAQIALGQITPDGVFIPPVADVFRKTAGEGIPDFPGSATVADNSCDGSVTVKLSKDGKDLEVLPACIIVCAHDFSPDVDPTPNTLVDYLKQTLQIPATAPPGNLHNQAARALDEAAITPATPVFDPGVEVSFGDGEVVDVKSIFYQSSNDPRIDPREMRVRYKSAPTDPGAVPGQLTSGLCSPWQSDYALCIGFWLDHLPPDVYVNETATTTVKMFRKTSSDTSSSAETLVGDAPGVVQIDKAGVARLQLGSGRLVETGREPSPGGDISDAVVA
jgi:L-Lysine epsilon oxidase N-terminal